MDLGCGLGSLTIDIASKGVAHIVGIDIDESAINFASNYVASHLPHLQEKVSFQCMDFRALDNKFDIIVSKAAFEHIISLDELLYDMRDKLKIGGKIVTGFGPLYNSPWGDHNRLKHKLPWSHVIIPTNVLISKLNKATNQDINDIYDLGLNGYSLHNYMDMFHNIEGLEVIDFRTNVSEKITMKLFDIFSKLPFLKEYFTYNIYCVLQRTS